MHISAVNQTCSSSDGTDASTDSTSIDNGRLAVFLNAVKIVPEEKPPAAYRAFCSKSDDDDADNSRSPIVPNLDSFAGKYQYGLPGR